MKNLYAAMRELYDIDRRPRHVPGERDAGWAGCTGTATTALLRRLGGGVTGFTKAYAVEQGLREPGKGLLVKALDVEHEVL